MVTPATRNLQNNCPRCKAMHIGSYQGMEERFTIAVGEQVEYVFFRMPCTGCGRSVTLFEAPFLKQRVFWMTVDERILSKFLVLDKITTAPKKNVLLYLYHPIPSLIAWDELAARMVAMQKEGFCFSAVYMQEQFLPEWLHRRLFRSWCVSTNMLDPVAGTKYPAPVLELNIRNELARWHSNGVMSVYTTCLPVLETIGMTGMDWEDVANMAGK